MYSVADVDEVFDRLNTFASETGRREFADRLEQIMNDPYPGDGDISPYKDARRKNSFIASFGDGLVVYQVMKDYPRIHLWDLILY